MCRDLLRLEILTDSIGHHLNPLLPEAGGASGVPSPLGFWYRNVFSMALRNIFLGSQMMNTCYGENRMKISRPYPANKIVELRCTNQFQTKFGLFLFPSR